MNKIICGDAIEEMKKMPENSVDAIITDPPYGLEFMGKEWDKFEPKRLTQRWAGTERKLIGDGSGKGSKDFGERFNEMPKYIPKKNKKCRKCGHYFYSGTPCECENPEWEVDTNYVNLMQKFFYQFGKQAIRVLKPGGFMLIMGGTRTYHRMTCGIEDAGFEIRDTIMWLYGSGFPKSTSISLLFDKRECMKQLKEKLGRKPTRDEFKKSWETFRKIIGMSKNERELDNVEAGFFKQDEFGGRRNINLKITEPKTDLAKEWEGWGTALKPACEPIVVARKPLSEKNVALNVLKWGTGGLNIDECRIGNEIRKYKAGLTNNERLNDDGWEKIGNPNMEVETQGRFPANIIFDEEAGKMLDEQSGITKSTEDISQHGGKEGKSWFTGEQVERTQRGDKGGASRFFYCAKASKSERNFGLENTDIKEKPIPINEPHNSKSLEERYKMVSKNNHPTVKPIKLMEYLIKLVSREGSIILDPFIGSGTTAIACLKLNRQYIGIEKEEEYVKIANARIKPFLEQSKLN